MEDDLNKINKLSVRMSFFAWTICAVLGWAFAITLIATVADDNSTTITAQNMPSKEDAQRMEQILPAAGNNNQ